MPYVDSIPGKSAIITGAGSGIGRATSILLAQCGASVVVSDINVDAANAVVAEIRDFGGIAQAYRCDIGHEAQICNLVAFAVQQYGRVDVMHNNAALIDADTIGQDVDILTISTAAWDRVMNVTLRGTMLGCRYAVSEMLKAGSGSIINTSSISGLAADVRLSAYGTSKAAINMLTQYVAASFGRKGIRCNAVAPSMIVTPAMERMIPAELVKMNCDSTLTGYLGKPEDVAKVVAFLASDDSNYLNGQIIRVDGGTTSHLPTYADARRALKFQGA